MIRFKCFKYYQDYYEDCYAEESPVDVFPSEVYEFASYHNVIDINVSVATAGKHDLTSNTTLVVTIYIIKYEDYEI